VREGLRIGVKRYALKGLEPLVGFRRHNDLRDAGAARITVELALEVAIRRLFSFFQSGRVSAADAV